MMLRSGARAPTARRSTLHMTVETTLVETFAGITPLISKGAKTFSLLAYTIEVTGILGIMRRKNIKQDKIVYVGMKMKATPP